MHVGDYLPEVCGLCSGKARLSGGEPCTPCMGKGTVLVRQPALRCPRCSGSGLPTEIDRIQYYASLCMICGGTGWVMTLDTEQHGKERSSSYPQSE